MPTLSHGRKLIYSLIALSSSFLALTTLRLVSTQGSWRSLTPNLKLPHLPPQDPFHLLPDYDLTPLEEPSECTKHFGRQYLSDFRESTTEYCESGSGSDLTCFHSQTDGRSTDSFCLGGPAKLDSLGQKFALDCNLRDMTNKSVPQPQHLRSYWYETGPGVIFKQFVNTKGLEPIPKKPKNYTILIKREGEGNPWHCLMEIFSMSLTIDSLKIDDGRNKPFLTNEDAENTQVVILDKRKDGPYFDLWSLFAKRPIVRLADIPQNSPPENIIVPLAGASNPMWQGDWEIQPCQRSDLLQVFSNRVLNHYEVGTPKNKEIVVTFIDRKSRRLMHQESYLEALSNNISHIRVQSIDFEDISFKEQLEVARATDVLVGVHGAGLTHGIFLRKGSVMVEILPNKLNHKGFLNVAKLLGHTHFGVHASGQKPPSRRVKRKDWHGEDIFLEEDRFLELMDVAIKSLYAHAPHHYDIN
ncbi:hypothetical protein FQN57_006057 [Myotisia sp. PD_48]|nr:hypothetical protein FQN57_006057 [Myotisia sp. PD_48]